MGEEPMEILEPMDLVGRGAFSMDCLDELDSESVADCSSSRIAAVALSDFIAWERLDNALARELGRDRSHIWNGVDAVARDYCSSEETSQEVYLECVFRKSRGLVYGHTFKEDKEWKGTQQGESERTEIFEHLGSLENLKNLLLKMKRVLLWACEDELVVLSDSEEYRRSVWLSFSSQDWEALESLIMPLAIALLGRAAVVFAAALLLSLVYQYLTGLVDNGSTKTYSAGSLEFRSTYISILLFQGAYVWIKSRDVAPPSQQRPSSGLHRKSRVTEGGVKEYYGNFEPRFKPPRFKKAIYVGLYEEEEDALTMYKILAFYYGKNNGELDLPGCDHFIVAPMTEQDQLLSGDEKIEWVKRQAKIAYDSYKEIFDLWCIAHDLPPLDDTTATSRDQVIGDAVGLDNLGDGLVSSLPNNCVGPDTQGMQQVVDGTLSGQLFGLQEVVARDTLALPESSTRFLPQTAPHNPVYEVAGPSEQRLEFPLQDISLQDHQANNSTINVDSDDLSLRRQLREMQRRQELQDLRHQNQISELRLQIQQQGDVIPELLGEIENIRNSERTCKRCRCDLTSRSV